MFKLFGNKHQEVVVKELPILAAKKIKTTEMGIARLQIRWSVSQRTPYTASIQYAERPTDWGNQGVGEIVEITADSWPELLDEVIKHFGAEQDKK